MSYDWLNYQAFNEILTLAKKLIQNNRFPQVLLLCGREGTGKKVLAHALAALFHCHEKSACGHCPSCLSIAQGRHPDIFLIDTDNKMIKLEHVQKFQEHLDFQSFYTNSKGDSSYQKVGIIADCDGLNLQSANRLLKTLEEPPKQALLILTTAKKSYLLPTILSRTTVWFLKSPAIKKECSLEKSNLEEAILKFLNPKGIKNIIEDSEKLIKEKKIDAASLIPSIELQINKIYRDFALHTSQIKGKLSPLILWKRRVLLRQWKIMALQKKVSTNSILALESLGLQGFSSSNES